MKFTKIKLLTATLLICLALPITLTAQSADDIKFATEIYPPFNFEQDGQLQGISVDLLVAMLAKINSSQTRADIQLWPWARGYQAALHNADACIFACTRTAEREDKFKWVGPIAPTTVALTARKDSNIKIDSLNDVKQYKVGVVIDDVGQQLLKDAGLKQSLQPLGGKNAIIKSIQKLDIKRIDLLAYEENVVKWEVKNNNLNPADYETVYVLKEGELYYAFNKDADSALIAQLQKALDEIKASGQYQQIVDKYLK